MVVSEDEENAKTRKHKRTKLENTNAKKKKEKNTTAKTRKNAKTRKYEHENTKYCCCVFAVVFFCFLVFGFVFPNVGVRVLDFSRSCFLIFPFSILFWHFSLQENFFFDGTF